jgi:UDP-glucose 4-epimerase
MYRREHGVEAVTVKWFNVYGPGQKLNEEVGYKKFIPTAIVNALRGQDIEIYGNGQQTMDLVHTWDTINATLSLVENWKKAEGGVYEIGCGEEVSVNDCAKLIRDLVGNKVKIKHIPMRKGEWKNTRIKADLKAIKGFWKPEVTLDQGLTDCINYYEKKYVKTAI